MQPKDAEPRILSNKGDEVDKIGSIKSLEHHMAGEETRMDRGYSGVACIMGFLILCIIAGQNNCSEIVFAALLDEYNTNRGQTGEKENSCFFHVDLSYGAKLETFLISFLHYHL